jgi:hypothetical protein
MSYRSSVGICAAASFLVCYPLLTFSAEVDSASQVTEATVAEHSSDQHKKSSRKKADAASGGASTTDDVSMDVGGPWAILESIRVGHPKETRYCAAVASADIVNPGTCDVTLVYVFTLTLDDLDPADDAGGERFMEFVNHDCPFGGDGRTKEVTTTNFFVVPPGRHHIYWLGRAVTLVGGNVDDASMTVVCTDERLPAD